MHIHIHIYTHTCTLFIWSTCEYEAEAHARAVGAHTHAHTHIHIYNHTHKCAYTCWRTIECTADNINIELSKTGLPQVEVLVKPTTTTLSSDPVATDSVGSGGDWVSVLLSSLPIIGVAVGGVL